MILEGIKSYIRRDEKFNGFIVSWVKTINNKEYEHTVFSDKRMSKEKFEIHENRAIRAFEDTRLKILG